MVANYGTTAKVKERLHIDTTDFDTEIATCLTSAEAWVDIELGQYTTLPLTGTIPQLIVDTSNDFAAAIFCENHIQEYESRIGVFRNRAQETLARYIHFTYKVSS